MATKQEQVNMSKPQADTSPAFSAADFAKWNQTTSLFFLPSKLVRTYGKFYNCTRRLLRP